MVAKYFNRTYQGKSDNAYSAESTGKYPMSTAKTKLREIISITAELAERALLATHDGEWHHVGKYANECKYYDVMDAILYLRRTVTEFETGHTEPLLTLLAGIKRKPQTICEAVKSGYAGYWLARKAEIQFKRKSQAGVEKAKAIAKMIVSDIDGQGQFSARRKADQAFVDAKIAEVNQKIENYKEDMARELFDACFDLDLGFGEEIHRLEEKASKYIQRSSEFFKPGAAHGVSGRQPAILPKINDRKQNECHFCGETVNVGGRRDTGKPGIASGTFWQQFSICIECVEKD